MLVHWIWFATRPGLNDCLKKTIMERFADAEDVYCAEKDAFAAVTGIHAGAVDALADKNLKDAEAILEKCLKKDIQVCTWQDPEYPAKLKNIADPPMVLYYKGQIPDVEGIPAIGVVGTRHASAYGMTVAADMGYQIARCGAVVVSGAADGIDAMAMQGALLANSPVVGVLGGGVDVVYPAKNRKLYADTEKQGCLISEYPPGEKPLGWHFPIRNRIISGLSDGVLVVEAPERSGALRTARHAAEQGRDVFVVPGNIGVETCAGSNALLREGAISVSSGWDVVSEYAHIYPEIIRRELGKPVAGQLVSQQEKPEQKVAQKPRTPGYLQSADRKKENKPIDNGENQGYIDQRKPRPELSQEENRILELMEDGCLVDDLIARADLPAGRVLSCLTMLQIKGLVRQLPGKRVMRKE